MTRHLQNPFAEKEGVRNYDISIAMVQCLQQLYQDFLAKRAGFELGQYYELYLNVSENKRVLSALFTPKPNLTAYLESYTFDYDIVNQKQILDLEDGIWNLPLDSIIWKHRDDFQDLIVPAVMLKSFYQIYKAFLHENTTGLPLAWHGYSLAFLGDASLMALTIYPAVDPDDWMGGVLGGLEGYVVYDLAQDLLIEKIILDFNRFQVKTLKSKTRIRKLLK